MTSRLIVNSIRHTGASADAITLDNSGNATFPANVTCSGTATGFGGGKPTNLVINGAMRIAQRNSSSTSSGYATVDRFRTAATGVDEAPTFAQVDVSSGTTPYTLGFRKAFKITNGNQTSGAGTNDNIEFMTKLEAQDIANSGWNYVSSSSFVTLSFWIKSSVAQNFFGRIQTADGTAQRYAIETGSLSADTWTKITKTIPGNSNITINNDNGEGLRISLYAFLGTDKTDSSSLNTWAASADGNRTPDQTSTWYTTNDATLEFTGVLLEVGDSASDYPHLSFAEDQRNCQRYCVVYQGNAEPLGNNGQITMSGANGFLAYGNAVNGASPMVTQQLPQVMRTTPSQSVSNGTHFQFWRGWTTTIASTGVYTESVGHSPIHFRYYIGSNGGMNNGDAGILNFSSTSGYQIYDAEL